MNLIEYSCSWVILCVCVLQSDAVLLTAAQLSVFKCSNC